MIRFTRAEDGHFGNDVMSSLIMIAIQRYKCLNSLLFNLLHKMTTRFVIRVVGATKQDETSFHKYVRDGMDKSVSTI